MSSSGPYMPPPLVPPVASAPMSEVERLGNMFVAPSKTFNEIAAGRRSWWLPMVVMCLFTYLLFGAITAKVGWRQVALNTLHSNAKTMERFDQMEPDKRAQALEQTVKMTQMGMEIGFAANPISGMITLLVIAAILMATVNFGMGGRAGFSESLAVTVFAYMPAIIKSALGAVVAWFMTPESFNLQNFAPTSVGAFLNPSDVSPWLYKLSSSLDFTTIWCVVLLGIGFSIVGKVKRSSALTAVFAWWGVTVLLGVVASIIFG